jgi:hypothetical protein
MDFVQRLVPTMVVVMGQTAKLCYFLWAAKPCWPRQRDAPGLKFTVAIFLNNRLRPTNGCLRISDDDMVSLLTAMTTIGGVPDACSGHKE